MTTAKRLTITHRLTVFALIWLGQLVSLTGSGLTSFALGVWVYQSTGSITQYALISFFTYLPTVVLSPVAGVLVDRWDRRWVMMLGDAGAGLSTLALLLLLVTGRLEIWHIYLATTINSIGSFLQRLAYYASTTLLVPKKHFGRSSGMIQLGRAAAKVATPVLAAWLVLMIDIQGVILIDVATFIFALFTLQIVRVPKPETSAAGQKGRDSFLSEATFGWTYVKARPGLLGLSLFFAALNLAVDMAIVLITPLVLSFADVSTLGAILSAGGIGMLCGGAVMSIWGGPKRRINGVYGFVLLGGIAWLLGGLQPSALLVAVAVFTVFFSTQIVSGCAHAIWQSKVAPDLQGRVFSVRPVLAYPTTCIAYLLAGPLADYVFEPLLAKGGPLAGSIGQIIGTGPGRGIGLLYIVAGIFVALITIIAYSYPRLRLVEDELPDAVTD
jgi:MFS family permease